MPFWVGKGSRVALKRVQKEQGGARGGHKGATREHGGALSEHDGA